MFPVGNNLTLSPILFCQTPAQEVKPLFLQYAKLEEDYGLAKRAMNVYDRSVKAVADNEKLSMYEIYIARAAEIYGVPKTRQIYEVMFCHMKPLLNFT